MIIDLFKKGNFSIRPKTYIDKEPDYNDLEIVKWNKNSTCYSVCYVLEDNVVSIDKRVFSSCDNIQDFLDLQNCVYMLCDLEKSDKRNITQDNGILHKIDFEAKE